MLIVFCFKPTHAQKKIKESKWNEKLIKPSSIPDSLQNLDAVSVNYTQNILTYLDPYSGMKTNFTTTERIKILTEQGKSYCNKFSLYKPADSKIIELDAITIKPNGEIIQFETSELKQVKQEIKYANNSFKTHVYKIAIPNVEIGDEVEIRYQIQMNEILTSEDLYFNTHFHAMKSTINLSFEKSFLVDIRTFNHLTAPATETTLYHKNYTWTLQNIASIQNADYSIPAITEPFVSFAIRYYVADDGRKIPILKNKWGELYEGAQKYLALNGLTGKQKKQLDQFFTHFKSSYPSAKSLILLKLINDSLNTFEIKPDFFFDEKTPLEESFEKKILSQKMLYGIYLAAMEKFKIPYEIGLVRNKYQGFLYNDYVCLSHIDDFILVPHNANEQAVYLYPSTHLRKYYFNEIPYEYENTEVVLIDKSNVNSLRPNHRFEKLPISNEGDNYTIHKYQISFNNSDSCHTAIGQTKLSGTHRPQNISDTAFLENTPINFISFHDIKTEKVLKNYPYQVNMKVNGKCVLHSKSVNDSIFSLDLEKMLTHQYSEFNSTSKRELPLFCPFPYTENYLYTITFPFAIKLLSETKYMDGNFLYTVSQQNPNMIFVNSKYQVNNTYVPAEKYDDYLERIDNYKMEKNAPIFLQKI